MKNSAELNHNSEAISTVIGVILMVAVTVAMAAVAYAYFTGMIGSQQQTTPTFSINPDENLNIITFQQMEKPTNWHDIKITENQGSTQIVIQDQTGPKSGTISNGEIVLINGHGLTGVVTVDIVYIPTATLVGQFTLSDVNP
jgi:FlaG/FlaF family flagellin (archaellin)